MTEVLELDVTGIAHGGEAVARHEGQVVFVRGALPGEKVRARLTSSPGHGRFKRAEVTEVIEAAPGRVTPPCEYSGRCGGCDWQYADLATQRDLKARVIVEQLQRLGKQDPERWRDLVVEAVPGDHDGLQWRTRMRFSVNAEGRSGLHPHHSHDVLAIDRCLIAAPGITELDVLHKSWQGASEVLAVAPTSAPVALPDPQAGMARVTEEAVGRTWTFDATAFWQVHPGAPDALSAAVRDALQPRLGDHIVDLYAGVGLFAGAVLDPIGPGGRIDAVEADPVAVKGARRSLHDVPQLHIHEDRVDRWLRQTPLRRCDLVVLDPPRSGAGREVLERVTRLRPRAIAYVACDPAALARDVAIAQERGWRLTSLRAFDIFPMTHHVECVALLQPADSVEA